jgi:hypothetical protein
MVGWNLRYFLFDDRRVSWSLRKHEVIPIIHSQKILKECYFEAIFSIKIESPEAAIAHRDGKRNRQATLKGIGNCTSLCVAKVAILSPPLLKFVASPFPISISMT